MKPWEFIFKPKNLGKKRNNKQALQKMHSLKKKKSRRRRFLFKH